MAMSRAKRLWLEGLLRAFWGGLASIVGSMATDPADFNFSEPWRLTKVGLIAAGVMVVQYLAQKPLPPSDDEDGERPIASMVKSMTGTGAGLFLLAALLASSACGASIKSIPTRVPVIVAESEDQLKATMVWSLGVVEQAGSALRTAQKLEIEVHRTGAIPDDVHRLIQEKFLTAAKEGDRLITDIETKALATFEAVKVRIDGLLKLIADIQSAVAALTGTAKKSVLEWIAFGAELLSGLGLGAPPAINAPSALGMEVIQ